MNLEERYNELVMAAAWLLKDYDALEEWYDEALEPFARLRAALFAICDEWEAVP
jgi:hypothetical protein